MEIDLSNCEKEPIHLVNAIQDYGYFVRFRYFDLKVLAVSEDLLVDGALPERTDLFAEDVMSSEWLRDESQDMRYTSKIFSRTGDPVAVTKKVVREEEIHLEFERADHWEDENAEKQLLSKLMELRTVNEVGRYLVKTVQALIGYDRVMLYKFDEEYNGHVVHEARSSDTQLASYLGHRFPASDIPSQARAMLVDKLTRQIQDVDGGKTLIQSAEGVSPLDMTYSEYRYPSEIHLEYLRNMQVKSTFTISLMYQGQLWGLVACHHGAVQGVSPFVRTICDVLARQASLHIEKIVDQQSKQLLQDLSPTIDKWNGKTSDDLSADSMDAVCKALGGDHYLLYDKGKLELQSDQSFDLSESFHDWIHLQSDLGVFYTNALQTYLDEEILPHLAGILILPMGTSHKLVICRTVYAEVMKWAGNPDKATAGLDAQGRISPRKSFETWVGQKNKLSDSWENHQVETARKLVQQFA